MIERITVTGGRSEMDGRDTSKPSVHKLIKARKWFDEYELKLTWSKGSPTGVFTRSVQDEHNDAISINLRHYLMKDGFKVTQEIDDE